MPTDTAPHERQSIAFIGNYLPRRCGIATFTHDLCEAVAEGTGQHADVFAVAMNDVPEGYPYPERVRFEVRQAAQADYPLAAEFLNIRQLSTVCLQHEYGIFGGPCGSHVLPMLRGLRRPLVTTLHTVLKAPSDQQRLVLGEICRLSDRVVVMSRTALDMAFEVFDVPRAKLAMIPHGIPDVPFVDPHFHKDQFGVEGRRVLLTFGLLSPGKGVEYALEALPAVVRRHPDVIYIVLGATHPHVKREFGEEYRNRLVLRAKELGLADHVRFVNRFVSLKELCEYLGAADLYLTPYLNEQQITSGTLAYAMGAGKAVVSTPYWYAAEMLADGRGRLVPFRDADAIAEQVLDLLDNETERHAMRKRSYTYCRNMIWREVARQYLDVFAAAKDAWVDSRRKAPVVAVGDDGGDQQLPEIDLRHLRLLTDETGIIQHCRHSTPNRRFGYCTDDNARALIVTAMHWDQTHDESMIPLMQRYLAFLDHAFDEQRRRFRNLMSYDRRWDEHADSEDSHGRAIWGLGVATALCPRESLIAVASRLLLAALPRCEELRSPRTWAFIIVGLHAYLRRFGGDTEVRRYRSMLAERLHQAFVRNLSDDWPWCEDVVAYANAKLPHALIMSGKWMGHNEMIDMGKRALGWLLDVQTNPDGMLSPVGTNGWFRRGADKARFDQQPVEAQALIEACIEAYHCTREEHWLRQARKAFYWFLGDNDLRTPLCDFTTGGCRDGLHEDRVNLNQGAESTLAWLTGLLLMQELQMERTIGQLQPEGRPAERPVRKPTPPTGPVVEKTGTRE